MPILHVTVVLNLGEVLRPGLAAELADAAAAVLGSETGGTWVCLSALAAAGYAENGGGPPAGVAPVLVRILKARLGDVEQLRREAEALTTAIAALIPRPVENVHLVYEPPALGRVSFGGHLLTE